jgi:hypothetical protein
VIARTLVVGLLLLGAAAPLQTETRPKPSNPQNNGKRHIKPAQVMDLHLNGPGKKEGVTAWLRLEGDGTSDLDCDIIELRGSKNAAFGVSDHGDEDTCVMNWEWDPEVRYDLRVTNQGEKANSFSFRLSFE